MTTETSVSTTAQRTARLILARLAAGGPSTARDLSGDGVPRAETDSFAEAFGLLTRGGLVRCIETRPGVRGTSFPVFEVTLEGRQLARHLPPAR